MKVTKAKNVFCFWNGCCIDNDTLCWFYTTGTYYFKVEDYDDYGDRISSKEKI